MMYGRFKEAIILILHKPVDQTNWSNWVIDSCVYNFGVVTEMIIILVGVISGSSILDVDELPDNLDLAHHELTFKEKLKLVKFL